MQHLKKKKKFNWVISYIMYIYILRCGLGLTVLNKLFCNIVKFQLKFSTVPNFDLILNHFHLSYRFDNEPKYRKQFLLI